MLSGHSSSLFVPFLALANRYHLVKSLVDVNELVLRVVLLGSSSTLGFSLGYQGCPSPAQPC